MNRIRPLTFVLLLVALCTVPAFAHPTQQTYDVTKTFHLTIYGQVPPQTAFSVLYGEQTNRAVRYFLNSERHWRGPYRRYHLARGTALHFAVRVHLNGSENGTTFSEDVETLNGNMTNTESCAKCASVAEARAKRADHAAPVLDTGMPGLPLGGLAAGIVFVASALLMRRRR